MKKKEIDFDLRFILNLAIKHWALILISAIISIGATLCYNSMVTPLYRSNISLFTWNSGIDDAIKSITNTNIVSNGAIKNPKVEQVMLYNSVVAQSLKLGQSLLRDYQRMLSGPEVRNNTNIALEKEGFKKPFSYSIQCSIKKKSSIMDMTVTAADPALAEAAANTLLDELAKTQVRLMKISYCRTLGPASRPTSSFFPRKRFNLLVGLSIGIFCGFVIVFFVDYLNMNIKTPEDLRDLNLLPLGIIPSSTAVSIESIYQEKDIQKNKRHVNSILDTVRLINTTISYLRVDNPPKVIALSSVLQQAGKSTCCLLLAKVIGASSKRVLIIDCDLRKPRIYSNLSLPASPGLVDFLADLKSDTPVDFINKNVLPNVDIMTHGVIPPTPTELLGSRRFQDMISNLKNDYDIILLDCPPSSGMADAMVLAQAFDAMIMVIEADKTRIHHLNVILEQLHSIQDKIIGGILNKVNYKKHSSYYYNSSYYYAANDTQEEESQST